MAFTIGHFREWRKGRRKEIRLDGDTITRVFHTGVRAARTRAHTEYAMGALELSGGGALTPRVTAIELRHAAKTANKRITVRYVGSKVYSAT